MAAASIPGALQVLAALSPVRGPRRWSCLPAGSPRSAPGPQPWFRGRMGFPAIGFGSCRPHSVATTPGRQAEAMPGRLLNRVVPKRSVPVVMSKGMPDCTIT